MREVNLMIAPASLCPDPDCCHWDQSPQPSWEPRSRPSSPQRSRAPIAPAIPDHCDSSPRPDRARPASCSKAEDDLLLAAVNELGSSSWTKVAALLNKQLGEGEFRTAKQCRERYNNYLKPAISQGQAWTLSEDRTLFALHFEFGNSWTRIAKHLLSRSDGAVKNRFYSLSRKSFRRMLKLLGCRDGTRQIRNTKPLDLSLIFDNTDQRYSQETVQALLNCAIKYSRQTSFKDLAASVTPAQLESLRTLIALAEDTPPSPLRKQFFRGPSKSTDHSSVSLEGDFDEPTVMRFTGMGLGEESLVDCGARDWGQHRGQFGVESLWNQGRAEGPDELMEPSSFLN